MSRFPYGKRDRPAVHEYAGRRHLVNGYNTNWNLTALKIWMLEQNAAGVRDVECAKDADWLVSNLLDPQWIVSVRVE